MTATAPRRNHAPVSLPAFAYDREQLGAGLDKAASADPDKRAAAVSEAVFGARAEGSPLPGDMTMRADQKLVEREHAELPGVVEKVRVFDPDSKGAERAMAEADRRTALLERQAESRAGTDLAPEPEPEPEPEPAPEAAAGEEGDAGPRRRKS